MLIRKGFYRNLRGIFHSKAAMHIPCALWARAGDPKEHRGECSTPWLSVSIHADQGLSQERASAQIQGEFLRTHCRVNLAGGFLLVDFFRAFFLEKNTGGNNPQLIFKAEFRSFAAKIYTREFCRTPLPGLVKPLTRPRGGRSVRAIYGAIKPPPPTS